MLIADLCRTLVARHCHFTKPHYLPLAIFPLDVWYQFRTKLNSRFFKLMHKAIPISLCLAMLKLETMFNSVGEDGIRLWSLKDIRAQYICRSENCRAFGFLFWSDCLICTTKIPAVL